MTLPTPAVDTADVLKRLGVSVAGPDGQGRPVVSPIDGNIIARVPDMSVESVREAIGAADSAFRAWRLLPPPRRGELVRLLADELRACRDDLARLVTLENGKILSEGVGEVQEMIDMCDFAVGLSRQLYGLTIACERPGHRMMETWHPLGVTGIITAFNFPMAVWAWNAAIAVVCGNAMVWKPSEATPLTALAVEAVWKRACARFGEDVPADLLRIVFGGREVGEAIVDDTRVPLVSATGSTAMGRAVGPKLATRFARAILELGGNNAGIVCPSADLDLTLRAVAFGAMATAGQRCTTMRRLFVHQSIYDTFVPRLKAVYSTAVIGDPRADGTLVGPLIDARSFGSMQEALARARADGGRVHGGGRHDAGHPDAYYPQPALVEMESQTDVVREETFAPILYVMRYSDLRAAIDAQNAVPQGLSASIFTTDMREAGLFTMGDGADCGIVNVNIGTSGAEIGGAFGGEKETGGGREAGADAWKAYMRRATNTINYSSKIALAQGVKFDVTLD